MPLRALHIIHTWIGCVLGEREEEVEDYLWNTKGKPCPHHRVTSLFPLLFSQSSQKSPGKWRSHVWFWGILRNEVDFGRNCLAWEKIIVIWLWRSECSDHVLDLLGLVQNTRSVENQFQKDSLSRQPRALRILRLRFLCAQIQPTSLTLWGAVQSLGCGFARVYWLTYKTFCFFFFLFLSPASSTSKQIAVQQYCRLSVSWVRTDFARVSFIPNHRLHVSWLHFLMACFLIAFFDGMLCDCLFWWHSFWLHLLLAWFLIASFDPMVSWLHFLITWFFGNSFFGPIDGSGCFVFLGLTKFEP